MTISGKGNTLDHIRLTFPDIPVPEYVRFSRLESTGWFDRKLNKIANRLRFPLIIRSDYQGEDGVGHSFAGKFDSVIAQYNGHFKSVFYSVREEYKKDRIKRYAESRGVPVPDGPIDVILQKYIPPGLRGIISEHPSGNDYLIDFIHKKDEYNPFPEKNGFVVSKNNPLSRLPYNEEIQQIILRAIHDYERIAESINPNFTGQMEFSINPYSVFQYRQFKFKETETFKLPRGKRKKEIWYEAPLTFGQTPSDGLELTVYQTLFSNWAQQPQNAVLALEAITDEAPFLSTIQPLPGALFFMEIARQYHPLQSHDTFCLLERNVPIAFVDSEFVHYDCFKEARIRYWSDGRRGLIKVLEKPNEID